MNRIGELKTNDSEINKLANQALVSFKVRKNTALTGG